MGGGGGGGGGEGRSKGERPRGTRRQIAMTAAMTMMTAKNIITTSESESGRDRRSDEMAHDSRRGLKTRNIIIIIIIIYPAELNVFFFFFFSLRLFPLVRRRRRHVDGSVVKYPRRVWRETGEEKRKKKNPSSSRATSVKICLTRRRDRCGSQGGEKKSGKKNRHRASLAVIFTTVRRGYIFDSFPFRKQRN